MLSELIIKHNDGIRRGLKNHQCNFPWPTGRTDAYDAAQIAIGDVIQALDGVVPEEKVIAAIGDARDPNAVSRALRNRLSFRFFN